MGAQLGGVSVNGVHTPVPRFASAESETKKVTRTPTGDVTQHGLVRPDATRTVRTVAGTGVDGPSVGRGAVI